MFDSAQHLPLTHTAKSFPVVLADQYISFSWHHWKAVLSAPCWHRVRKSHHTHWQRALERLLSPPVGTGCGKATIHTDSMHWTDLSAPCWHRVRKSHQKWNHVLSSLLSAPVGTGCGKATYTNTFGSPASYPYFWARKPIPTKRKKKEKNIAFKKKLAKQISKKPKRDRKYIFM